MLALVVQNHPNRTGPDFRREFVRRLACHGSHLLKSWSLRQSRGGSVSAAYQNSRDFMQALDASSIAERVYAASAANSSPDRGANSGCGGVRPQSMSRVQTRFGSAAT